MKKIFTMLFAAAAVLASCSQVEEPEIDPGTPSENSFFYGSIDQLSDPTRTTLDGSNGVQWEKDDEIVAYPAGTTDFSAADKMSFYAEKAGAASFFSAKSIPDAKKFHEDNDSKGYDVYFGTVSGVPTIPSSIATYTSGSVTHLPMYAAVPAGTYGPGQRKASFNNVCAVLKVTIPAGSLTTSNKFVVTEISKPANYIAGTYYVNNSGVATLLDAVKSSSIEYDFTATEDARVFYVPVLPGDHMLSFAAKEGTSGKRTIKMVAAQKLQAGTIYSINMMSFDYTIDANTKEINLPSNGGTANIKVTANNSKPLTIKYADESKSSHPETVYIDGGGYTIDNLTINLPASHVELSNGTAVNVVSTTSSSTLEVKNDFTISTNVDIKAGSLIIYGSVTEASINESVAESLIIQAKDAGTIGKVTNNSAVTVIADVPAGTTINNAGSGEIITDGVVKVGEQKYFFLADAVEAASTSAQTTITAIHDFSIGKATSIAVGKDIVFDLNGKEVLSGDKNARISVDGGSLTIQDSGEGGTIYQADATDAHTIMVNSGTLTVNSGTITSSKSAAVYAMGGESTKTVTIAGGSFSGNSGGSATIAIDNGTLTIYGTPTIQSLDHSALLVTSSAALSISGGTIKNTSDTNNEHLIVIESGECTLSGADFIHQGTGYILRANKLDGKDAPVITVSGGNYIAKQGNGFYTGSGSVKINVQGGNFYSTSGMQFIKASSEKTIGSFSVTGGYFTSDPIGVYSTTPSNACVSESSLVVDATNKQTVDEVEYSFGKQVVKAYASIGSNKYPSLEAAYDASSKNNIIKLLDNYTLQYTITVGGTRTLDLNGKTLTCTADAVLELKTSGTLTISTYEAGGNIFQDDDTYCIDVFKGTLTISEGVSVVGHSNYANGVIRTDLNPTGNITVNINGTVQNSITSSKNNRPAIYLSENESTTALYIQSSATVIGLNRCIDVNDNGATITIVDDAKIKGPLFDRGGDTKKGTWTITGGYFSEDPSAFLSSDYTTATGSTDYPYHVVAK